MKRELVDIFIESIPYTSKQEKDALIILDEKSMLEVAKILVSDKYGSLKEDLKELNDVELESLIFRLRAVSVNDTVQLTTKCPSCDTVVNTTHDLNETYTNISADDTDINNFGYYGDDINLVDVFKELDIDNLSITEYNKLEEKLKNNSKEFFKPKVQITCHNCNHTYNTILQYNTLVSESTLLNIYQQYVDISYYSNNTKLDVDSMYPFEREIYIKLIQKKIDDEEKALKAQTSNV